MSERLHNFAAGPGTLPLSVLEEVKAELLVYRDAGASIMEISHRSGQYSAIAESARARLRRLLRVGDDWHILFLQGGASMQFYQVPLNFLHDGNTAAYVNTGAWSVKAIEQAEALGTARVAASSEATNFDRIPDVESWERFDGTDFVHITTNNTIYGTQFRHDPQLESPLIADVSSDFLSRPMALDRYDLVYAGAQKNLGPAGVTVVMIKNEFLGTRKTNLPAMLDYGVHASKLYNTPPVFAVYIVEKVLAWIESIGDLHAMAKRNREKADLIYNRIDASDFYSGHAQADSRSLMNITFRLDNEDLEDRFAADAKKEGLLSLKGHRSVGGIRASLYNACSIESAAALADFMSEFERTNG